MSRAERQASATYAIISPVRDEVRTLRCTLASVLAQTVAPARWVIVDDGSRDGTRELIERMADRVPFIRTVTLTDRGHREPGAGVVAAFEQGLEALAGVDFRFVAKLDGDIQLPVDYYESVLGEFDSDSRLGIASGVCLAQRLTGYRLEPNAPFHTRGPCKVYRRECLEDIGGLAPMLGWDGLDGYKARMRGWRTRSLPRLQALHFRPTHSGDGPLKGPMRAGRGAYNLHYRPGYLLARALLNLGRPPVLLGGLGLALGYLAGHLRGLPRLEDPELVDHIQAEQANRLHRLASGQGEIET